VTQILRYPSFLNLFATDDLDWANGNGWKCMLLTSAYTYDETHDFINDLSGSQVASGGGYTTGGATLANLTKTYLAPWRVFSCDAPAWTASTITARYAAFYKDTGTPSTSPVALVIDAEEDRASVSSTFSVPINPDGLFRLAFAVDAD